MTLFLYIITGILLLLIILGLLAPKNYNIFRSIVINKNKAEVFEHLKFLRKQQEWSPWAKKDPNMEKKFTGVDGEVGAISYWNGNKEVGEGEQEITRIITNERIEGELRFFKPWKSISDCYFNVKELEAEKTIVTWGFSGKNKFPVSLMMLFMNMDKSVGKDFEKGLADLKGLLEA